ncbi:Uncharacterized conserved protein [Rhodovulum sp. ES.010]|uniref:GFA family protein n=1 Tax=Rhodovulum sp. ES.010 TaxID=1882821 RepID=UPI000925B03E|nr:GFA family protein [Rhodovulum sp. ES.010]SIO48835.1 Uncharacterized conserved protein [Rhodovulum sp. ES.010]
MTGASRQGGCLCGAVRYRLTETPEGYGACHCGMCRRWTGALAFAIDVAPGGIAWEGAENIRTYASSDWAERGFCGVCGANLFWRMTAPGPMQGMTAVMAGTLDSLEGLEMTQEIYIDAKPSGHAFAGDHQRLTEAETLALYGVTDQGETS